MTILGFVGWALVLAPVAEGAQPARSAGAAAQASPAPEKRTLSRRKPKILHAPSPAQESPAQRDRRLARECQGLPNAGACLGYALPRR